MPIWLPPLKIRIRALKRKNTKVVDKGPTHKKQQQENKGCFFCNKELYTKKECTKVIRHFRLSLGVGFYLNLKDTFLVLSFRQNLFLVSLLDKFGYSCSFGNNQFYLSLNSNIIDTSFLKAYDNLYMLEKIVSYNETLHVES